MEDINLILKQARALIGTRVSHKGHDCTVIEVLEDSLQLILEADRPSVTIQSDAYGNARREMRAIYNVLCNEDGTKLKPLCSHHRPHKKVKLSTTRQNARTQRRYSKISNRAF